ncbi:hypothetical protein FRC08_016509 [Ceratobasidium sp. 394]|nr:hypothetical protein FRC08_016509 [Ceratobasidium sp. 394]KAG9084798.1 hypothetical protein FS749_004944 [Ceratobasidium sp. UAMH 11750]
MEDNNSLMNQSLKSENNTVRPRGRRSNGSASTPPGAWEEGTILEGRINGHWVDVQIDTVLAAPDPASETPLGSYWVLILNPAKGQTYTGLLGEALRLPSTSDT